jgi:uncharacterized protein YndB with AHSA1/START domain
MGIELTYTKKEATMTGTYERTFVVAVPVARAWAAFADPKEREAWNGRDRMENPATLEAFEATEMKAGTVQPNRRLSWSQSQSGLAGYYETTVTFEEVESGTKITIVRSGFGDTEDWRHYAESTNGGWDEMIADLILYMETGVRASRHLSFRSGIAATTTLTGAGVRITHVVPGGFAEGAGMQAGDLLLRLNGVPMLRTPDIAVLAREHNPGEVLEAEYVRSGEVLRGRAPLSEWNHGTGVYVGHPGGYPKPSLTGA